MGKIHSIETFGTVDGPGVRFVVFFQGCPMRCLYCHNPDTWQADGGTEMTAEELLARYLRNASFYKTGGITATGGEPMLQLEFLTELFSRAKERGIHTCLDTSGIFFPAETEPGAGGKTETGETEPGVRGKTEDIDRMLAVTDLVMLDIKHIREEEHRKLTGHSNRNVLAFARYLEKKQIPVWIRHVVVPQVTLDETALTELGRFVGGLSNVEKVEALPYHALGKVKYENLGMDYVRKDMPQLTKEELRYAEDIIKKGMK